MAFQKLLGSTLLKGGNEEVSIDCLQDKIVALYFSGHWCPPCRRFTPELVKNYERYQAAGEAFEVVFISADSNEEQFNDYFGSMPWLALPFSEQDINAQLSVKYGVRGIPALIILGPDGELITKEGRGAIMADSDGQSYPWRENRNTESSPVMDSSSAGEFSFEVLLGNSIQQGSNMSFSPSNFNGKTVGLYFSGHWCPPCRMFTPQLAQWYKGLRKNGRNDIEIVFVSSDRDQSGFEEYYSEMPQTWGAVAPTSEYRTVLRNKYEIRGIPTLVLVNPDGTLLSKDGRGMVNSGWDGSSDEATKNENENPNLEENKTET